MTGANPKSDLHRYLQAAREVLLWKLDGLSEYDIRRPLTPTGTNLLGLIKHLAGVELGYFGDTFGRPFAERLPWLTDHAEPNADMWASATKSRAEIVGLYRRAWVHTDATIATLALDSISRVPWWPADRRDVSLHQILSTWSPKLIDMPGTPISSANSSMAPPDYGKTTPTWPPPTKRGGTTTTTG